MCIFLYTLVLHKIGEQVFKGTFEEICCIQIKIYPPTSIVPKYGEMNSNNEKRVGDIIYFVQLS